MKYIIFILFSFLIALTAKGQHTINGTVNNSETQSPIAGATVFLKRHRLSATTDAAGNFSIGLPPTNDTLVISFIGYQKKQIPVSSSSSNKLEISLTATIASLQEIVINTGFYQVPKERATGSFTHITNEQLNRVVTPNIIDRIEGIANGLNFERKDLFGENQLGAAPQIRVHGVSTIESSTAPLIVVDNFPYESDLTTINPNDVESITVLKDAAAASIWGARAGNGVIVITTKQARYNQQTKVNFNSSITNSQKPDLYYNQNWLPSGTVMSIEEEMFTKGGVYLERNQTPIPAYVELLIKKRENVISPADFEQQRSKMQQTDIRTEALDHLYQKGSNQQHALNVSGGSNVHRYYFSAGYDKNKEQLIGDQNDRLNLSLQNTFKALKNLELTAGVWYTKQRLENNGINFSALGTGTIGVSPYMALADSQGAPLYLVKDYRLAYQQQASDIGLLDWLYRPLQERNLIDDVSKQTEMRLTGGLKYQFLKGFNLNTTYQYLQNNSSSQTYYAPESYYVRNMVNRFTQTTGEKIIPYGGIQVGSSPIEQIAHSGRIQMNYQGKINEVLELSALAGADIRQQTATSTPGFRTYGYDKELRTGSANYNYTLRYPTRPTGTATILAPPSSQDLVTDRYLSYFANAALNIFNRYDLSGSIRWDGSNIFGVKTNQKGVPLWSSGIAWDISKEDFYKLNLISLFRLRATYGSSGNVNNSVSVYPIIGYQTDQETGLQSAALRSAGNPSLRWEKVKTFNTGLDLSLLNNRIQVSADLYVKNASDLIGQDILDPSTGIWDGTGVINKINYADLRTRGLDIQLNTRNLNGNFTWESNILFSYVNNKVTDFNTTQVNTIDFYVSGVTPPVPGNSLDQLYAFPWNGLDRTNGQPIIYIDGNQSTDYNTWYNSFKINDLVKAGLTSPPYFGSIRNTFSYKGLQLSANIIWKAGYEFRRKSMYQGYEYYAATNYHMDYFKRWQKPGDEVYTNVPAAIPQGTTVANNYAAQAYMSSTELVTNADHIRLQDINLSYSFSQSVLHKVKFQSFRVFAYARNLGILWRANENGIDPEYAGLNYPVTLSISVGIQAGF